MLDKEKNDSTENITMIVGHTRAIVTSSITNKEASFILIRAIKENHGMIGQWFTLRKHKSWGHCGKVLPFQVARIYYNKQYTGGGNSMLSKSNSTGHYTAEFHCQDSAWLKLKCIIRHHVNRIHCSSTLRFSR